MDPRAIVGEVVGLDPRCSIRACRRSQHSAFCCDEELERLSYHGVHAEDDLAAWRDGRLSAASRELIDTIAAAGIDGATMLDVGAGIGAVHLTLLERGAARAIDVDASREYLAAARDEARRRGLEDRVVHRYGDVVELVDELGPADVVTLDSVICCYRNLGALLGAVLTSGPRLVGITYPRDVWWMRAYMRGYNLTQELRGQVGHYYIHRHAELERRMADAGYRAVHDGGIRSWRVVVYRRDGAGPTP